MTLMSASGNGIGATTAVDAQSYSSAMLNILADSADERARLADTERAVINILEDLTAEKSQLSSTQRAFVNILEDANEEKLRLADTQRAVLNILEDFDSEKRNVEHVNSALRNEIAERMRAEEALRYANLAAEAANQELESFSYSVAHDMRAPLRSIDGFSLALLEDCSEKLDDEGKKYLKYVRESAQHMARLIDDLLSLSRVTRAELHRVQADISIVARSTIANLQRSEPDRVVELVIAEQISAFADARLLGIVLDNLLGNAWKFTGKSTNARIEFGQMSQDGRQVYFVRDNGAGFDMAYDEKLFAPFQRLHKVSEFDGTGIGLATVQRIIHRHGGRIWAEGAVGQGATFYFTLEEDR